MLVQVAYAIGVAQPVSLCIKTEGKHIPNDDAEIARIVAREVDMTPAGIINKFNLRSPIYEVTASYGHFGREPAMEMYGDSVVETFPWEKLDLTDKFKDIFFS